MAIQSIQDRLACRHLRRTLSVPLVPTLDFHHPVGRMFFHHLRRRKGSGK